MWYAMYNWVDLVIICKKHKKYKIQLVDKSQGKNKDYNLIILKLR